MEDVMASNKQPSGRRARIEHSRKQAKKKRLILIAILAVVVLAAGIFLTYSVYQTAAAERFGIGSYEVVLRPNGRFTANLFHNTNFRGRYTLTEHVGMRLVTFTHGDDTVFAEIVDDDFYIPQAWQDACGTHEVSLPRR